MNAPAPRVDFEAVARLALAQQGELLSRWFPAGRKLGREFVVGNLAGAPGDSLSINTQTGRWADFEAQVAGGDLTSLYAAIHGVSQIDAARRLMAELGQSLGEHVSRPVPAAAPKAPVEDEWTPILPVPADAPDPPDRHPRHGVPAHVAVYRNRLGQVLGLIYRCEPPGRRKQIPTLTFCRDAKGRRAWQWKSLPKPRSLYGAEFLDMCPDWPVMLVEGEPKCDAARRLVGDHMIVLAWPGGSNAVAHADWSLLAGRDVLVWPDADEAGYTAARDIVRLASPHAAGVRVVPLPADVPEGWDLADAEREGWTTEQVLDRCDMQDGGDEPPPDGDDGESASWPHGEDGQIDLPSGGAKLPTPEKPTQGAKSPAPFDVPRRWANLPPIDVSGGEIDVVATFGEEALVASRLPVFRRDKDLVRPITQLVPASGGRLTVAAGLATITLPGLIDLLNQAVEWRGFNKKEKAWKPIDPPGPVAAVVLARAGLSRLPSIAGVITTPTLRPDGSVLAEPGYDEATRLYHVHDPALKMPRMPAAPTRGDAERALKLLQDLLHEFPWKSDTDRAVAISAIVTAVVRGALSVVPMHAFKASAPGSGKSYLVDLVSLIATGRPCPVMAVADQEAETEKRLTGLLLSGFPIISLDNVNGELGGDLLCQAIERPLVRARPLGASAIVEIESRATICATGNGFRVKGDMTRRTLVCALDAKTERPELRDFADDPAALVLADRGEYVAACLTIVRAYLAAGKPNQPPPLASFGEWNSWVRGSLLWLGCFDPVASMETAREDDPELSELRELLALWESAFGKNRGMTARELDDESRRDKHASMGALPGELEYPDLRNALMRIAGEKGHINTRRLGRWFMDKEGRVVGTVKLGRLGTASGGLIRWGVIDAND